MGLESYLFKVRKGAEKYIKDNKCSANVCHVGDCNNVEGLNEFVEQLNLCGYTAILGASPTPYKFEMPNCNNPEDYCSEEACFIKNHELHFWFLKNVQKYNEDMSWHEVKKGQLKDIIDTYDYVIKYTKLTPFLPLADAEKALKNQKILNPEIVDKYLPIFEYWGHNGLYIEYLKETVATLKKVMHSVDFNEFTLFYNGWR